MIFNIDHDIAPSSACVHQGIHQGIHQVSHTPGVGEQRLPTALPNSSGRLSVDLPLDR